MSKHKRFLRQTLLAIGLVLFVAFTARAVAQNVAQGYRTDQKLQSGTIVRLKENDGANVEALTQQFGDKMFGVVVSANSAPVVLSDGESQQEVFVAAEGKYDVLVSSQNGEIKVGDYIAISAVNGVGMRATNADKVVLGRALQAFDGKTNIVSTASITGNYDKREVAIGRVKVDIGVLQNPLYQDSNQSGVPGFLSRAVQVVTDEPVSAMRIYASLLVLFITLFVAAAILFAGVRSGMIAIGRNPLAKKLITRNILQVTIISLIIFIIGLIAVYLLLRL